jgi:hypothetical protein
MNVKQVEQHIPVLGMLHLVGGALFALVGIFVFFFLTSMGAIVAAEDTIAPRVLMLVATSVGALLLALALPGMLAGYGLLKRRAWARGLAIAVGILNLLNFPLGTLIGIYTLAVLMQADAAEYFAAIKPA